MNTGAAVVSFDAKSALDQTSKRIDQGITAHCALRDKYEWRSTAISVVIVLASTVLTFLPLASEDMRALILRRGMLTDHVLALCGLAVLLLSILEIRFNWKELAAKHAEAAGALSRLKLVIKREAADTDSLTREQFDKLQSQYESLSDLIAKIPESKFLKLKALHRRKIELSKLLDTSPGASIPLLRVKLWFRDNFKKHF